MKKWGHGARPPKGVKAIEVWESLGDDQTPDNLLEVSKRKRHPLHSAVWGEGDQVWAARGRLDYCRKILRSIKEEIVSGGKTIEVRAVEFVHADGEGRWYSIDQIKEDDDLCDAYVAEIIRLQDQASSKMLAFRALTAKPKK